MSRTIAFVWPLPLLMFAALLPSAGCIAPAVVSGVDPELGKIIAPGGREAANAAEEFTAEPRKLAPTAVAAIDDNRQSLLTPSLAADPIPAVEPIPRVPATQPAGHTLPPRISLGQAPTMTTGEPTAALPTAQRIKPLRDISLDITPPTLASDQQQPIAPPTDYAAEALPQLAAEQPFVRGELAAAGFDWQPSPAGLNFCYQPLYFEEVNTERYGHSFGILQPAVSAVAFYGRIPLLPYMAFARPARRCTYHAHWALPGYKIPRWEPQPIVPSVSGAAAEVAVIYGLVLLIP